MDSQACTTLTLRPLVSDGVCPSLWFAVEVTNNPAPPWYNGYRFVLTFIVCTSIVFNLIVKGYLQETEAVHGTLNNLKIQRKSAKELEDDGVKRKYPSLSLILSLVVDIILLVGPSTDS